MVKTLLIMVDQLTAQLHSLEDRQISEKTHLKTVLQAVELPLLTLQSVLMIKTTHSFLSTPDITLALR